MHIGIFDSGLGGLTVLKKCLDLMPEYNYIYLADNANVPYGNKSPEQIYELMLDAVKTLLEKDCKLVVVACNTATANGLRKLQQDWLPKYYPDRRVLGIIRPAVEAVIESGAKRVGVMATQASVNSKAFEDELNKFSPAMEVFQQACPALVPLIEAHKTSDLNNQLLSYINPLLSQHIDTLLLGCTHYEFIKDQIQTLLPQNVQIISEGIVTVVKLQNYLKRHPEIESTLSKNGERTYINSANDEDYFKNWI